MRLPLPLVLLTVLLASACSDAPVPAAPVSEACRPTKASAQEQAEAANRARDEKDAEGLTPRRKELEAQQDAATRRLSEIIVASPDCFGEQEVQRAKQLLDAPR